MATIANPESKAEVRLEAFNLALLSWGEGETRLIMIHRKVKKNIPSFEDHFNPIHCELSTRLLVYCTVYILTFRIFQ